MLHHLSPAIDGTIQVSALGNLELRKARGFFLKKVLTPLPWDTLLKATYPLHFQRHWAAARCSRAEAWLQQGVWRFSEGSGTAPDRDWTLTNVLAWMGSTAHSQGLLALLQTQETELACSRGHQHLYCKFNLSWKTILLTVMELKLN